MCSSMFNEAITFRIRPEVVYGRCPLYGHRMCARPSESQKITGVVQKEPCQASQNEYSNGNEAKPKDELRIRSCLQRRQRGRDQQILSEPTIQHVENKYPCDASENLARPFMRDGSTGLHERVDNCNQHKGRCRNWQHQISKYSIGRAPPR